MASSSELWIREYNEAYKHAYDSTRVKEECARTGSKTTTTHLNEYPNNRCKSIVCIPTVINNRRPTLVVVHPLPMRLEPLALIPWLILIASPFHSVHIGSNSKGAEFKVAFPRNYVGDIWEEFLWDGPEAQRHWLKKNVQEQVRVTWKLWSNSKGAEFKVTFPCNYVDHYTCNVRVEYEWKPPRCSSCKVFGHIHEEYPKNTGAGEKKTVKKPSQTSRGVLVGPKMGFKPQKEYRPVFKKPNAISSGNKNKSVEPTIEFASNTPIGEKIDNIERQICKGKLRLLDNDGNPLVHTGIMESDSEVEEVFDETANLRISTSGKDGSEKGYGIRVVAQHWFWSGSTPVAVYQAYQAYIDSREAPSLVFWESPLFPVGSELKSSEMMRIEQYIQMIDYALWEVIENGATLPKTTAVEGVVTVMPIATAEEKA
ncbi:hypothetical protein Tco_1058184 [Tanacetum coccineum]|uniref:Uncharacterized protein n=1 Tax=Tanacetum coccineum TaxID=301880 RepID=A0ABQ5H9D8_9ASTR